jgi:decaprenylphospho-beta-D-ribofuranose 2-oxidase
MTAATNAPAPHGFRFVSLDRRDQAWGERIDARQDRLPGIGAGNTPLIARGSGISFAGASFGDGVCTIDTAALGPAAAVDDAARRITVAPATTLAELYRDTVARQLYLPALPGHPQISVGGSIACNVHGKSPARHGTFVDHVESLELFHPRHGTLTLSRDHEPDLFELTCGGLGLTGVIVSATLRLSPLPSPWVEVTRHAVGSLAETVATMEAEGTDAEFIHSWNDLSVFDGRLGRGYVAAARFAPTAARPLRDPLDYPRHDPSAPTRSFRWFRPTLVPWIAALHRFGELQRPRTTMELYDFVFPGMGFRNANYYACYGPRGLIAHAVLVPGAIAVDYFRAVESTLRRHRVPLLVASMKRFRGQARWLRFDGDGTALHAHIPNDAAGARLAADLEGLSREAGAPRAVYIDSRVGREDAAACFPGMDDFRERLTAFDPGRRFQSALSRRLGL